MMVRKPNRTVNAPASGCRNPQARFCTAMARVKSDTDIATSWVSGCRKMPSDWRKPMLRLSISDAPIRIGSVGRRTWNRDTGFVLPLGSRFVKPRPAVASDLITQICVIKLWEPPPSSKKYTGLCNDVFIRKTDHEGADPRDR